MCRKLLNFPMRSAVKDKSKQKGISVIEIIVAIGIIVLITAMLAGVTLTSSETLRRVENLTKAHNFATIGMEKVRAFRDNTEWENGGLGDLDKNISYSIEWNEANNAWEMEPGERQMDFFTKEIYLEEVRRNGNHDIITDGSGDICDDTIKIVARVSWQDKNTTLVNYLTAH